MPDVSRNPRLLCIFHAMQMSLFPVAIVTPFWKHRIGMSMGEILLLQAIFGITVAAPTNHRLEGSLGAANPAVTSQPASPLL